MEGAAASPLLLDDTPEAAATQLWAGLDAFATRLSRLIPCLPGADPVLITGPWGSGKTTLLRAVQARLEETTSSTRSVWFEAWRHESVELLLPALVRMVWDARPQKEARRDVLRTALRCAVVVACRGARVAATAAGGKDLVDAWGSLKDWSEDLSATADDGATRPEVEPTELLHQSLARLIVEGWPEAAHDVSKRPVIFVDDLDRCDPGEVVAFIEQIRQIIARSDALPCRFVLAVDHDVLVRAISSKFASIGSYDGNRYLEKVFPFAFALPAPDEQQVAELLGKLWSRLGLESLADDPRQEDYWREHLSRALSDASFANPRLMKRCINRFMLVQYFESSIKTSSTPTRDQNLTLAKWLAATERWPALRRVMLRPRAQIDALASRIQGVSAQTLGTDLEALISEPGAAAWWTRELHGDGDSGVSQRLEAYQQAERCLRRWGL